MTSFLWKPSLPFLLLLAFFAGCDKSRLPVGGVVDMDRWEEEAPQDAPNSAENAKPLDHASNDSDARGEFGDRPPLRERQLDEKGLPPTDALPSRTERWGHDRPMPSRSMPSQAEKWGRDRKMPSDSPSAKPLRPPLPSERN